MRREPDPHDRRGVRVTITDAGEKQYDAGLAGYVEALAGRLHKLDETQRIALQQAIAALDAVLSEGGAEPADRPAS